MPQQPSRSGEDDGPPDETKTYHTEGEQEEKINENAVGVRESFDHLNDVKSSLVNEGESASSSTKPNTTSQRNKRLGPSEYVDSITSSKDARVKKLHGLPVGEGSKAEHFHDIARFAAYSNLAIIAGGYHPNGSMVPGSSGSKLSMVHPSGPYPPSLAHLMMYNQEHYPPGTPPPPHLAGTIEVDAKTGIPRPRHSSELPLYHPLSPGSLGSVPHHLEVYNMPWQGQPFYPLTSALRSPYPALINASGMSRLGHPGLPPHHHGMAVTGIPHPAIVTSGTRQQDTLQQSNDRQPPPKEEKTKTQQKRHPHIKKPLNAFMLYMKEKRASVVKECTLKESAAINQILGRRWHALSREEQAKYYELARKERQLHMQLYPSWTARDNYAVHGKKKKKKKDKNPGDNSEPSTPKKCRARFGVDQQEFWCKPCRRKKKCIRYICPDENGQSKEDDSCESDDEQSIGSPTAHRMPNNVKPPHEGARPPASETPPSMSHSLQSNGSSHSHARERGTTTPLSSTSSTEPRPPLPTQTYSSSPVISTQPAMHLAQSPMVTQTSPAIVHLPHPSISHAGHHMSFTSTSPMMVFPSQPPIFAHTSPQVDMLRAPPFPNGLTPHGLLQLHAQSRPPPTPEMPQDLSMKSATVTA
ncbi:transcription factor 7-like 2 isoform X2 [Asterias amurensis]|uniref:transcription factor 7-like 2 isoform X2 n=2 Tax=Asterias TaxID=7601 RepID=UPI003AB84F27